MIGSQVGDWCTRQVVTLPRAYLGIAPPAHEDGLSGGGDRPVRVRPSTRSTVRRKGTDRVRYGVAGVGSGTIAVSNARRLGRVEVGTGLPVVS